MSAHALMRRRPWKTISNRVVIGSVADLVSSGQNLTSLDGSQTKPTAYTKSVNGRIVRYRRTRFLNGITVFAADYVDIQKCKIYAPAVSSVGNEHGLWLFGCSNFTVANISLIGRGDHNTGATNYGASVDYCAAGTFSNIVGIDNHMTIVLSTSPNVTAENVRSYNCSSSCDIHGLGGNGATFRHVKAYGSDNRQTNGNIFWGYGSQNITLEDIVIDGDQGTFEITSDFNNVTISGLSVYRVYLTQCRTSGGAVRTPRNITFRADCKMDELIVRRVGPNQAQEQNTFQQSDNIVVELGCTARNGGAITYGNGAGAIITSATGPGEGEPG